MAGCGAGSSRLAGIRLTILSACQLVGPPGLAGFCKSQKGRNICDATTLLILFAAEDRGCVSVCLERVDVQCDRRLDVRCLVLVDDVALCELVEHLLHFRQHLCCFCLVCCSAEFAHCVTHCLCVVLVVKSLHFGLTDSFLRRFVVCHNCLFVEIVCE